MTKIELFFTISISLFVVFSVILAIVIFKNIMQLGKTVAIFLFLGVVFLMIILIAVLYAFLYWSAYKMLIIMASFAFAILIFHLLTKRRSK